MNSKELIRKYIGFFKTKKNQEVPNASLIPTNDPTVLFTTAGMHPLVPYLLGQPHPKGKRIVDVQKCIRTGDIDEVGDTTHHTFFEMLGNWSLGDYFKEEAIHWSYELLVHALKIPAERLAISCFGGDRDAPKDEESAHIWESLGIPSSRIAFLPKRDNWWGPAGAIGPCGPDTEMFYWTGPEPFPQKFDPADKKWVEIWNDVFMQYHKQKDGSYIELKQKNVDTGMGVERTLAVLNALKDNYQTDLFWPIIEKIAEVSGKKYEGNEKAFRVIADHLKAAVFILSDDKGVKPSNVEHGYVLRRLIRRAIRYGRMLGITAAFTVKVASAVLPIYPEYEELKRNKKFIFEELEAEERRFTETLEKGMKKFNALLAERKKVISGAEAFLLFQSYGFPIEMTTELAGENGVSVDVDGFEAEYKNHQDLSRTTSAGVFKSGLADNSEATTKLHTSTHLLNEALRQIVKQDIRQKGSNINPERLRFDFNYGDKLNADQISKVEKWVNDQIAKGLKVTRKEMPLKEALRSGVQAEFGEKYPDIVSVYTIGDEQHPISREICTGPHVKNTKEIGHFKIVKEQSSAAGVRRIKAVIE